MFIHSLLRRTIHVIVLFIICAGLSFTTSTLARAENTTKAPDYVPLVGIPGIPNTGHVGLETYLNAFYILLIAIGALIAFIKISIAGVKYALSDIVTDKSSAKRDIYWSLIGLAILLIPAIVLKEINPNLLNLDVFGKASSVSAPAPIPASSGGTTVVTPMTPQQQLADDLSKNCPGMGSITTKEGGGLCCARSDYTGPNKCPGASGTNSDIDTAIQNAPTQNSLY